MLLYGFNHDEATRSFQEAAALDPEAAMPWWGVAYAAGMNINDPEMTEERWQIGHEAAQKALALLDDESDLERALVEAVAQRYTWPAPAEQRPYDEAYAAAMEEVYERFGDDPTWPAVRRIPDGSAALGLLDRRPGAQGPQRRSSSRPSKACWPSNPTIRGPAHFYIHAMEAGPAPEKAVPYAETLETGCRAPDISSTCRRTSTRAWAATAMRPTSTSAPSQADRDYFAEAPASRACTCIYYAHNQHFLAYASMMEARYEPAMKAARELEARHARRGAAAN